MLVSDIFQSTLVRVSWVNINSIFQLMSDTIFLVDVKCGYFLVDTNRDCFSNNFNWCHYYPT